MSTSSLISTNPLWSQILLHRYINVSVKSRICEQQSAKFFYVEFVVKAQINQNIMESEEPVKCVVINEACTDQ